MKLQRTPMLLAAPLLAATILLTACGGGSTGASAADCLTSTTVPSRVGIAFLDGAKPTGKFGVAKSGEKNDSVLLAVEYLPAKAKAPVTGVWYADKLEAGQIFSVDEHARKASDWGQGAEGDSAKRTALPGYKNALGCLK